MKSLKRSKIKELVIDYYRYTPTADKYRFRIIGILKETNLPTDYLVTVYYNSNHRYWYVKDQQDGKPIESIHKPDLQECIILSLARINSKAKTIKNKKIVIESSKFRQ